jgi:hypothetical protein
VAANVSCQLAGLINGWRGWLVMASNKLIIINSAVSVFNVVLMTANVSASK